MDWVSLHTHTTFSMGDGYGAVPTHISRVGPELGMKAVGFSEHGSTSSWVQLEQEARKAGIKPIFGVELYVTEGRNLKKFHQTVFAMNEEGLRNLNRLVTRSYDEGKYGLWPTVHTDWLLDPAQTRGLIVLSGCADSWLSCSILGGKAFGDRRSDWKQEDAQAGRILIERFQEVYGDRYYLEQQQFPDLERSTILNQLFCDLSQITGAKTVATADVHYPYPDQNEMQRILHAALRPGTGTIEAADQGWEYDILLTYPESDQQIVDALKRQELSDDEAWSAVLETKEIAARCDVELPKSRPVRYRPSPTERKVQSPTSRLKEWLENGIDYRLETNPRFAEDYFAREDAYWERIDLEFGTVTGKGFEDYLLVTADLCQYAKRNKIGMGPGRGSGAGSLLLYLLRITEINPMFFPLMQFERFIDPSRPDMPDIDLDFADPSIIFAYGEEKYGYERVSHIANFARFRGKSAVKDIARVYQIDSFEIADFTKLIVDRPDGDARENDSVEDTIESFQVAADLVEKYPELRLASKLEGDYRGLGKHAAGMVISTDPIADTSALYMTEDKQGRKIQTIAYDKRDAEYLNILKLDILGLTTMQIIADVIEMVDKEEELNFEMLYALPLDDQKVLRAFAEADVTGVFQFDGRTTRNITEKVFKNLPEDAEIDFNVLADINALSRPGSLISGMTKRYEGVAQGTKEPEKYHPIVNPTLETTNGCLVYQEQVMSIGREMGKFPGAKVGALRRIIGKKKAGGAFEAFYEEFLEGATAQGVPRQVARQMWDFMATSSSYLFNIAHAVAYAVIAYWCMYIKINYPAQFYAASLRRAKKTKDKDPALALMQDAVKHGIEVLPISLEHSEMTWEPTKNGKAVRAGFMQIQGVGEAAAPLAKAWRDQRRKEISDLPFEEYDGVKETMSWDDMRYIGEKWGTRKGEKYLRSEASGVKGFGPKMLEKIKAFTMDPDPFRIYAATWACNALAATIDRGEVPLSRPTANARKIASEESWDKEVVFIGLVKEVRIIDVVEAERKRTNHTREQVITDLRDPHLQTKAKIIATDHTGLEIHINVHRWMYPEVAGELSEVIANQDLVHVEGISREGYGPTIQANTVIVIEPTEKS